jgi:hypothetical protein
VQQKSKTAQVLFQQSAEVLRCKTVPLPFQQSDERCETVPMLLQGS